tara:strand:- start:151 stop:576 length:426 start_codon:yes stop_codon:yes gene_type:complete
MGTKKLDIPSGEKVLRLKDKTYLKWVSSQPCLLCLTPKCQAHHLTFAMPRGFGQKTGDQWAVPLCPAHHSQLHTCGKGEKDFWKDLDIDAEVIATTLYQYHLDQKKSLAFFEDETILWVKIYNNLVPKLKKHVDFLMQPKL